MAAETTEIVIEIIDNDEDNIGRFGLCQGRVAKRE
jgi:hypothetical protein